MQLAQRIAELEQQNAELNSNLTTANDALAQARTETATAIAERDAARNEAKEAATKRDAAVNELADLKAKQEPEPQPEPGASVPPGTPPPSAEEFEKRVGAEVTKRLAAAGVPPVRRVDTPAADDPGAPGAPTGKGRTASTWARNF